MAGDYPITKIGEIAASISETHKFGKEQLVFLNTSDILHGKFLHRTYSAVKDWPGQAKKSIRRDDILFSEIRPANGRWAYVDHDAEDFVVSTKLMVIRARPDRVYPKFLYQFLTSSRITKWLQHLAESRSGTFPQITFDQVATLELPLPPPAEQRAIAEVIGALDDKILLNGKINSTLEAMARALFQSWFVDFDPVRAKLDGRKPAGMDSGISGIFPASFQDSSLGKIPAGWRATTLGEVIDISDSKRIPLSGRERETRQGKYPYHGAASVMDYVDDFLFDGIYLLMGEDGSVINEDGTPVLQYVWGKFWVNNHAHVLQGKNGISTEHLFLHLKGCNIAPFVNGAVQPKLNQGNMNRIAFVLPTPEVCNAFTRIIQPLFDQIRANSEQSRILAHQRDTLLPKLLSGELSIADLVPKGKDGKK